MDTVQELRFQLNTDENVELKLTERSFSGRMCEGVTHLQVKQFISSAEELIDEAATEMADVVVIASGEFGIEGVT